MGKLENLKNYIKDKKTLAIAFSGGIDSSLVAKVAHDELKEKAIAVTLDSEVFSKKDLDFSKKIAKEIGIKHIIIKTLKLNDPIFVKNSEHRCYYCKKQEIDIIKKIAREHGINNIAYGVNKSDHNEHRPGIKALKEKNILFPLEEAGIGKSIIPQMAQSLGLSNYNMPSTTCLASRVPYGDKITIKKLIQIEKVEIFLNHIGLYYSRARHHGDIIRIEVPQDEFDKIILNRDIIIKTIKKSGFKYITLDLQGYRSGSMDEVL